MNLSEAYSAAVLAWFDSEVSTSVLYNGVEIPGHVSYGGRNAPMANHASLTVRRSDVPAPSYRDTVVIEGQTWRVFQDQNQSVIMSGDAYTWEIPIIRGEKRAL